MPRDVEAVRRDSQTPAPTANASTVAIEIAIPRLLSVIRCTNSTAILGRIALRDVRRKFRIAA
jgi:hypothetical protein